MTVTGKPTTTRKDPGVTLSPQDLLILSGDLGSRVTDAASLRMAVNRARAFSVAGTEVTLDSGTLERIKSRAQASRVTPGEWLRENVLRLLRAEVGS